MVGIDFGKPLFTSEEIQRKIHELGARISADYAEKDVLVVGVLKGALFFMADLLRALRISVRMDFIHCTSSASKGAGGHPSRSLRTFTKTSRASTCSSWRTSSIPA